nr:MAG TPA: zinc cluster domain protein [Inoviridae sp.]
MRKHKPLCKITDSCHCSMKRKILPKMLIED